MRDGLQTLARSHGHATGDQPPRVVKDDIDWLLSHLRALVAASPPAVWAGRGMTLSQLVVMHLIGALAPISLTDLAKTLGTRPPATSAMVDRLTQAGMVRRDQDSLNRRRVTLTLTAAAQAIVGGTDPDTARRLHRVLGEMSPRLRRHVIDVLRDTIHPSTA